jgi:hypothetical protein
LATARQGSENGMFGIYRLLIKKNMVGDGFRWLDIAEIVADGWLTMVCDVLKEDNGCVSRTDKKREFSHM